MIDQNIDLRGCFKVMDNVTDLHKNKTKQGEKIIYLPLQKQG